MVVVEADETVEEFLDVIIATPLPSHTHTQREREKRERDEREDKGERCDKREDNVLTSEENGVLEFL